MSKYQTLDELILARIDSGHAQFNSIFAGAVQAECTRIAERESKRDAFRVLDGRLQAMRRAGKLRFSGGGKGMGWQRVDTQRKGDA